jgi:hypothetical protein
MGITLNCLTFLAYARSKGVSFSETLMLGRQQLYISHKDAVMQWERFKIPTALPDEFVSGQFSEPLFKALGANIIDSVDQSAYEGASILHNMNLPFPPSFTKKYSVVFDGGTLEHIFNFPVAVRNCMEATAVGGHFITITPANNQCGHGFYQFSPELFFSLFSEKHGFETVLVAMGVDSSNGITEWYEIENPKNAKRRIGITNSHPTYLMVIARKTKEMGQQAVLEPFQSDYEMIWNVYSSIHDDAPLTGESRWIHHYRRWMPGFIKSLIRMIRRGNTDKETTIEGLGKVNPLFFKKMEI